MQEVARISKREYDTHLGYWVDIPLYVSEETKSVDKASEKPIQRVQDILGDFTLTLCSFLSVVAFCGIMGLFLIGMTH